jgi:ribosomal RNA-processing protein 7
MTAYAEREAAQKRKLQKLRQVPDDDGFITVTRGGRTMPARQEEALAKLEQQKERQKPLTDFYRFQSREKRKERAVELVKRFEEDREKVRKMRERRRGAFKVCFRCQGKEWS